MASPANLNDISQALANLLEFNVKRLAGSALSGLVVSRLPPEKADESQDTRLNVHLYHVSQDNDGGSDLPEGQTGLNPIATRPMALKLFFVLTAHATITATFDDVASQHALMGWALKTLHDFGEIFEDTNIGGQTLFSGVTLGGRPIEIIIRPIEPEESVSFWSVDKERSARLSAFLELRTLLLNPEPPQTTGIPVLQVGLGVQPGGAPVLSGSQSTLSITRPAALGGGTLTLPASPAVGVLRASPGSGDALVSFSGGGLGDGTDAVLVLRGQGLTVPALIEPASNPEWRIVFSDSQLQFEVRPTVWAIDASGAGRWIALAPGLYSIALQRRRTAMAEDGTAYPAAVESNRQPLTLAPALVSASLKAGPDPRNVVIIVDAGSVLNLAGTEAMLGLGGDAYEQATAFTGSLAKDAGKFVATGAQQVEAVPKAGLTLPSGTYPLRLTVNGADSPPAWLGVP
ncbi:Pvc16 family protein [Novosphingobium sp. B 225]|uniref:Pvc16 family protein n=1 Tax=Novosphingobium sp. B 225 TaxID=1961849 RepID=UPI000B4BDDBD|nr:Pvc16 family protein [Novosphingobium sp. B 225]